MKTISLKVFAGTDFCSSLFHLQKQLSEFWGFFDLENLNLGTYHNIIIGIYQPNDALEPGISQDMIERLDSIRNCPTL